MIRSFASKLGGQFATESHGQFLRNIHLVELIEKLFADGTNTTEAITYPIIESYKETKLRESNLNNDILFSFGYDKLKISVANDRDGLSIHFRRATRPLDNFDEEQLMLDLFYEGYINDIEEFSYLYEDDELNVPLFKKVKNLIPTSFRISTRYDA